MELSNGNKKWWDKTPVEEASNLEKLNELALETRQLLQKEKEYQRHYFSEFSTELAADLTKISSNLEQGVSQLDEHITKKRTKLNNSMHANGKKLEIPPELQKGLESVEAGAIPALITRRLENFLTELGLYRSSMTPEEAWKTLQQVAKGEPATLQEQVPNVQGQPEVELVPDPIKEVQSPPEVSNPGGLRGRINRKKQGRK